MITAIEPPTHIQRYVLWDKDGNGGMLFLLVGYCPDTLPYFLGLFQDALKSVPDLNPETAICGKVRQSDWCQNFTIMVINVNCKKRIIDRFKEVESMDINY